MKLCFFTSKESIRTRCISVRRLCVDLCKYTDCQPTTIQTPSVKQRLQLLSLWAPLRVVAALAQKRQAVRAYFLDAIQPRCAGGCAVKIVCQSNDPFSSSHYTTRYSKKNACSNVWKMKTTERLLKNLSREIMIDSDKEDCLLL